LKYKNVTIIIHDITKRAGTERAVCNLANIFIQYGMYLPKIISIHSSKGESVYLLNKKVEIIHFGIKKAKNKFEKVIEYIFIFILLNNIIKYNNIDILIGTIIGINIPLSFIKNKNIIKIACEHFNYNAVSKINMFLRRLFYQNLDAVVVLTLSDKENYYFTNNVKVIPNSLSFLPKKKAELQSKIILSIGRYSYQKNFEAIIKAIFLIKEKCFGWQVRIIGDGEEKEKLVKLIKEKKLEDIVLLIPPTNKIEKEYYNADFFVMCSHFEGLPMVLIEAKSYGLPLVSFDCPYGPSEIIRNNIDGILVENGNINKLAEAILKLIENPELKKEYGNESLKDIEKYSPEIIFYHWDNLFKEKLCYFQ